MLSALSLATLVSAFPLGYFCIVFVPSRKSDRTFWFFRVDSFLPYKQHTDLCYVLYKLNWRAIWLRTKKAD